MKLAVRAVRILLFTGLWVFLGAQSLSQFTWPALSATGSTSFFAVPGNDIHTIQAIVTGSPASCTMNLDGSLDTVHWFDLSGGQTCTSTTMFHVVNRGVTFVRGTISTLSGGSSPTVTISYLGQRSGGRQ